MRWQINFPKLEIRLKLDFFLCMPSARPLYARSSSYRFVWFVNCLASNFATSTLNSLYCWTPFFASPLCCLIWFWHRALFHLCNFFIAVAFNVILLDSHHQHNWLRFDLCKTHSAKKQTHTSHTTCAEIGCMGATTTNDAHNNSNNKCIRKR